MGCCNAGYIAGDLLLESSIPGRGAILVHIDSLGCHALTDEEKTSFYKILAVAMSVPESRIETNLSFYKVWPVEQV